jgi:hypothetical protein
MLTQELQMQRPVDRSFKIERNAKMLKQCAKTESTGSAARLTELSSVNDESLEPPDQICCARWAGKSPTTGAAGCVTGRSK